MSKPLSHLFKGTKGEKAFYGDAERVIAERAQGLDLREHPIKQKQLSAKERKSIAQKIRHRTATREEYVRYIWDKRFRKRRRQGVEDFYAEERKRLLAGEQGTRNWTKEQREQILSKKTPIYNGKPMEAHHTFSARKYPHLANHSEIIYPATHLEHHKGWHGGNYRKSLPGKRIRPINEF